MYSVLLEGSDDTWHVVQQVNRSSVTSPIPFVTVWLPFGYRFVLPFGYRLVSPFCFTVSLPCRFVLLRFLYGFMTIWFYRFVVNRSLSLGIAVSLLFCFFLFPFRIAVSFVFRVDVSFFSFHRFLCRFVVNRFVFCLLVAGSFFTFSPFPFVSFCFTSLRFTSLLFLSFRLTVSLPFHFCLRRDLATWQVLVVHPHVRPQPHNLAIHLQVCEGEGNGGR